MAIVKKLVVKEGWEDIHEIATERLKNIDVAIDKKVAEYREKLEAESIDDIKRYETIISECVHEIEVDEPETNEVLSEEQVATDVVE